MLRWMFLLCFCSQLICTLTAKEIITLTKSTENYLELEFNNPEFTLTKVNDFSTEYTRIDSKGLKSDEYIGNLNAPTLPSYSKLINLYNKEIDRIEYSVIASHENKEIKVLPYYDKETADTPVEDTGIYAQNKFFPEQIYTYSPPMIMRGTNLSNLTISPFTYNPIQKTLKVYDKIILKVFLKESNKTTSHKMTSTINNLIKSISINNERETATNLPKGSYVYIYSANENSEAQVLSILQPLLDWKHRQGYEVVTQNMVNLGTTTQSLKNYLTQAYNTWENPPEFVCLVGDASGDFMIPAYSEELATSFMTSDYDYTLIEGDDLLPEMIIGRLSFETYNQLAVIVNKILKYESQPFISDDSWYERSLLVGDASQSGESTQITMNYINDLIKEYNPDNTVTMVTNEPFVNQTRDALNQGVSAYFYRGFYGNSGWTAEDTYGLTNGYMLPFVCEITCHSGIYLNYEECQTEAMLRAGTVAYPKGAVAAIGSSCATHTCINNILTGGIAWGIYKEQLPTIGEALVRGKIALVENYPANPANYVSIYTKANNLMGDPGMVLWTRKPTQLLLQYPQTISIGTNQVDVTATSNGQPVANVWVCLWKGEEVFISGVTNAQGFLRLLLPAGYTTGEMKITASLQNYIPVLGTINISETNAGAGFVSFEEATPFQSGTNISFKVKIKNYRNTALNNVSANITSLNNYLTFTTGNISFGNIPANSEAVSQVFVNGSISGLCPDQTELSAMLNIVSGNNSWPCAVSLQAKSGNLTLEGIVLNGPGGNYINPGQSGSVVLSLKNTGSVPISNLNLVLRTNDPRIVFSDSLSYIQTLEPGQMVQLSANPFELTANSEIIKGSLLNFQLIGNSDNMSQTMDMRIQFGNASITDPTGPEQYGYYCYDDSDIGYNSSPQYNWIEISPSYGGSGTLIPCEDTNTEGSGQITTIDSPFPFKFYGTIYDKMSICTNGFIVPGISNCIEWMNRSIPGPMVPEGIIAPFWDDLLTSNSQLCYYYDEPQHQVIVEWSDFLSRFDNLPATFQVIISDPAFNATTLGDSKIKFQYKEVHNTDTGSYGGYEDDHGEYSTVGISDRRNTSGLEYTFSNNYPVSAKVLANNMALLFTGPPTAPQNAFIVMNEISFTETIGNNNNIINNHEVININLALKNIGLTSSGLINLHLTSPTNQLTINQANTTLNNLGYNQSNNNGNLQFTVANNCPNGYSASLILHITYGETEKEFDIPIQVQAPNAIINGYQITTENDNYLESGENGIIAFSIKNDSDIPLANCDVSLIFDNTAVSISPDGYIIPILAPGTTNTQNIAIDIPESVHTGEIVNGTFTVNYNQFYQVVFRFEIIIGAPELIFSEDFEGNYIPNFQAFFAEAVPAQYINESGTEVKMEYVGEEMPRIIISKLIPSKRYKKFLVNFKYYNQDGTVPVIFGTYDQVALGTTAWASIEQTAQVESVTVICDNLFPNAINQQFFWRLTFTGEYTPQFAVFDDIKIYGFIKPSGTVSGHITLNGGNGLVTDATIFSDSIITHPDVNGNFTIDLIEGQTRLTARIPGYETRETNVVVIANQTVTADYTLNYLTPPVNLVHTIQDNHIVLNWADEQTTRTNKRKTITDSNRLSFNHYKIYWNFNNFHLTFNTTSPHFERTMLGSGHYIIYVTSIYNSENGTNAESDTSNVLEFDYVGSEDNTLVPKEYAMSQNYPNPFNPTTRIDFALPERNANCNLSVYNIKGEHIKTLITSKVLEAGNYSFSWDGNNNSGQKVGSGIYFFKLRTDKKEFIRKAVLLK